MVTLKGLKKLQRVEGDVTSPIDVPGRNTKIVAHSCNNVGAFGSGVAGAIAKKWPHVRDAYLTMFDDGRKPIGGAVQYVVAEKNIIVANIIGQNGLITWESNPQPVRFDWIEDAIHESIMHVAMIMKASIHVPMMGCGLGGGTEEELLEALGDQFPVPFYLYDLPKEKK